MLVIAVGFSFLMLDLHFDYIITAIRFLCWVQWIYVVDRRLMLSFILLQHERYYIRY